MVESDLSKKMKLKPEQRALVWHAPEGYMTELGILPSGAHIEQQPDGLYDWIQVFVHTQAELKTYLPQVLRLLKPETSLWITFPKGSSKLQTDLTRDRGWDPIQETNLKWITLISINSNWSAFGFRPLRPDEPRNNFMAR